MKFDEMSKEQLLVARNDLQKKMSDINELRNQIDEQIFNAFDVPARETFIGKCFSYENSFGGGTDIPPWMEYVKINSYNKDTDMYSITTVYSREDESCIKVNNEYAGNYDADSCIRKKPILANEFKSKFSEIKTMML